jgi:DNA-binding transcriptional LysR family regulator
MVITAPAGYRQMEILQLEHFLAVVDEGTFTRAAERVFRTQPAISQSIKKLEEEIGAALLIRGLTDVSLTEAGKLLVDYARRIIALRDQARRDLGNLKDLKRGSLEIAAYESAAVYLLSNPLHQYLRLHSGIRIALHRCSLDEVPRLVLNGSAQIGFVKEPPVSQELEYVEAYTDEIVVVASPRNELVSVENISINDLDKYPIVLHQQSKTIQRMVLDVFEKYRVRCNVVAELCNFENIKQFVQANVGIAVVPRITVENELKENTLVELPLGALNRKRSVLMVFRPNYLPESAKELVNIMQQLGHRRLRQESCLPQASSPSLA